MYNLNCLSTKDKLDQKNVKRITGIFINFGGFKLLELSLSYKEKYMLNHFRIT